MKKYIILFAINLFLVINLFGQTEFTPEYFSEIGDKKAFKIIDKDQTVQNCESFIQAFPKSNKLKKVNAIYEETFYISAYDYATSKFNIDSLKLYITKFPNGKYINKANETIDIISWQTAKNTNTTNAYEEYIRDFPNGRAIKLAKNKLEALKY